MKHFIYILYSTELDRFYTGSTSMLPKERLSYHLTKHTGYTSKSQDWEIVHVEEFDEIKEARSRERRIKKRGARRYLSKIN